MGTKLGRNEMPSGHSVDDFKCFGPAATKDGEFGSTMLADMGCFMQEGVDSNKYYHGAVVQSTKTDEWFAYFEYGRVGAANPAYQFVKCTSKDDAIREYVKQLESKNVKRGVWVTHAKLGQQLEPKKDKNGKPKDLYVVRPLATRSTGLPDAKTITQNEGAKAQPKKKTKSSSPKKTSNVDPQTVSLMRDLSVATVSYTRSNIVGDSLPTQSAIDEARDILAEATRRVGVVGDSVDDQVNDTELKDYTRLVYGRIAKKKDRNVPPEKWILNQDNIQMWLSDLDAFENALYATGAIDQDEQHDPLGGMDLTMKWLSPKDKTGEFIRFWMPKATKNRHGWVGNMRVKNVWSVDRAGDQRKLSTIQKAIAKNGAKVGRGDKPFHQPTTRPDLNKEDGKIYKNSNTAMLFHGTRSVNVSGILREALRMPRQLVGVVITGAMFGPGLYFADDWKKSAGYTSLRGSYWSGGSGSVKSRGAFMFVCDVALGTPFVAPGPRGYTAPPTGSHCVFGKAGASQVQNNEWIIYKPEQNKLSYLVEFEA